MTTNSTKLMDKYNGLMNIKRVELTANELRLKRKLVSWDMNIHKPLTQVK